MAVVGSDLHGLYVRVGGYVFRPVLGLGDLGYPLPAPSALVPGQPVRARHLPGTTTARVGDELWFSHGEVSVWDPDASVSRSRPTLECWAPLDSCS